jgi:hypothetical protein
MASHLLLVVLVSTGHVHVHGRTILEGDIVVEGPVPSDPGAQSAHLADPSGTAPYRFDRTMSSQKRRDIVKDSMAYISRKAVCMTFDNIEEAGWDTPSSERGWGVTSSWCTG